MKAKIILAFAALVLATGCKKDAPPPSAFPSRHGPATDEVRKVDIGCVIHSGTASYTIRIRIAPNHNEQDTARFVTVTQGAVVAGYYTGIGRRSYSVMARPSEFAALIDVRYALPLPATNVMYLQVGQDDNTLKGEFLGTGKPATEAHWRVELDPTLLHN